MNMVNVNGSSDKENRIKIQVPRRSVVLLSVILLLSVTVNVLLAQKDARLKAVIRAIKAEGQLFPGSTVIPIRARTLDGAETVIRFEDSSVPTVLYVFTPKCGWCQKNLSNLQSLIRSSASGQYRIVGISLTSNGLREYLAANGLNTLLVYVDAEPSAVLAYHLGSTPETIMVSPTSTVIKAWVGAYQGQIRADIENLLHVPLADCCKTESSSD